MFLLPYLDACSRYMHQQMYLRIETLSYRVRVHNDIFGGHWSVFYPSCIGFILNLGIFLVLSHFPTRSYGVRVVCSFSLAGPFIGILFITCAKVTNLSTFPRKTIPP